MAIPQELSEYLTFADPLFGWRKVSREGAVTRLRMVAQGWQGIEWGHDLVLVEPERRIARDLAILYITGADPNPLDLDEAHRLAQLSGLTVVHLFQIPVQPIWDLIEDDLIAETFLRFLDTGDSSWPLLFPMVKSAVRAMDVIGEFSKGLIKRFVVTGSSKRGWTAWLTAAAGDERVAGIAPMVFDNLDFLSQLQHQVINWQGTSEMISPYTSRGLHERIQTPEGQKLAAIVDPFTYRSQMPLPKMIITGSNDPYWSVDSLSLYWDGLIGDKWASILPNGGHGLGDMSQALHAIAALGKHCTGKLNIPSASWSFAKESIEIQCEAPLPDLRLWIAESETFDFRQSEWWPRMEVGAGNAKTENMSSSLHIPKCSRNQAAMVEMRYRMKDFSFSTSTPIHVWQTGNAGVSPA